MRIFLLLIIIIISQSLKAQNAFSLKQALDYASSNAIAVKNSRLDILSARERVQEVISTGLPQINGEVNYQNFINIPTQLLPAELAGGEPGTFIPVRFGVPQNLSASVTASQLLFNGSFFIGLEAARAYQNLVANSAQKTAINSRFEVASAYHLAVAAEVNTLTLAESEVALRKTYVETLALFQNGLIEEQAADQIKVNLTNIQNALENARQQAQLAKNFLKFQMGYPVNAEIILTDNIETLATTDNLELLSVTSDYRDNIEYKLASNNVMLQGLNVKSKKRGYYPTLSAFINQQATGYGEDKFDFFSGDKKYFPTTLVGVNLTIPIFDSFQKSHQIKQANNEFEKAKNMEALAREGTILEQQNARAEFTFQLKNFDNQKENLYLAEKIKQKTNITFKEGIASSFDLSQAENQFLQAQGAYIQATISLLNAKTKLERALNRL